jgi:type I restriction enzyme S subunit
MKTKDSGIEWIGEIPDNWSCAKLSYYIEIFTGNSISDGKKEHFEIADGIPYIATKDINVVYASVDYDNGMRVPFDSNFKIAKCGSVLLCIEGGSAGKKIAFIDRDVAFVNKLCAFKAYADFVDKYLYYFLFSDAFVAPFNLSMTGLIGGVSQAAIRAIKIVVPTKDEQQKIADFLDDKCAKIDRLIAHEESTIEELKAYKQSIITEAVTKGLDKSVPVKDSGVEWVGEVPVNWDMVRNKDLFVYRNERNFEALEDVNLISLYTDLGVVQHSDVEHTTGNKAVTADGYKIVKENDIVVNIILCWMGAIGRSAFNGVTSPAYDIYAPKSETNSRFYNYYFRTKGFNGECFKFGRGIMLMRWRTYSNEFRAISVVKPPIEEQQRIADYLDKKCADIDSLISIKQQKIEELKEYKKSLIYEYVTGKKEVA